MTTEPLALQPRFAALSMPAQVHLLELIQVLSSMTLRERVLAAQMVAAQGNSIAAFLRTAGVSEAAPAAEMLEHLMALLFIDVAHEGVPA